MILALVWEGSKWEKEWVLTKHLHHTMCHFQRYKTEWKKLKPTTNITNELVSTSIENTITRDNEQTKISDYTTQETVQVAGYKNQKPSTSTSAQDSPRQEIS